MKLYLDTSDNLKTIIHLGEHKLTKTYDSPRDQAVIPALMEITNKHNISLNQITSIQVHTGPGSFTGLRVGISIVNALSFALQIPINNQPLGTIITPNYGKPPSITISEKTGNQNII